MKSDIKNILVVDDADFIRLTLKEIFVKNGYNVVGEAVNGEEAFEKYKLLKPDLVTMDITMPKMNGIESTKKIIEYDPMAKIVIVTSMTTKAYITKAVECGAKYFIIKPFKANDVIRVINLL